MPDRRRLDLPEYLFEPQATNGREAPGPPPRRFRDEHVSRLAEVLGSGPALDAFLESAAPFVLGLWPLLEKQVDVDKKRLEHIRKAKESFSAIGDQIGQLDDVTAEDIEDHISDIVGNMDVVTNSVIAIGYALGLSEAIILERLHPGKGNKPDNAGTIAVIIISGLLFEHFPHVKLVETKTGDLVKVLQIIFEAGAHESLSEEAIVSKLRRAKEELGIKAVGKLLKKRSHLIM